MRSPLGVVSPRHPVQPCQRASEPAGSPPASLRWKYPTQAHPPSRARAARRSRSRFAGPGARAPLAAPPAAPVRRRRPSAPRRTAAISRAAARRARALRRSRRAATPRSTPRSRRRLASCGRSPRLLESVRGAARAHPQVAQRALALLLRCAAGGAAAACSGAAALRGAGRRACLRDVVRCRAHRPRAHPRRRARRLRLRRRR